MDYQQPAQTDDNLAPKVINLENRISALESRAMPQSTEPQKKWFGLFGGKRKRTKGKRSNRTKSKRSKRSRS